MTVRKSRYLGMAQHEALSWIQCFMSQRHQNRSPISPIERYLQRVVFEIGWVRAPILKSDDLVVAGAFHHLADHEARARAGNRNPR